MTATRPVQGSMFPSHAPDRPTGPIVGSVQTGSNADLIAAVADLYLTGTVLDVTYGQGKWWDRHRPTGLAAHDLKLDGVDFRHLPEATASVDTVCFDPPYVPTGTPRSAGATRGEADYRDRFGLEPRSRPDLLDLIDAGLSECARVARCWVMAKCCDYVSGGRFWLGHLDVIRSADRHGLAVHDLIVHHTGSGPGGHNIFTPLRARRHHSYLLVLTPEAAS